VTLSLKFQTSARIWLQNSIIRFAMKTMNYKITHQGAPHVPQG